MRTVFTSSLLMVFSFVLVAQAAAQDTVPPEKMEHLKKMVGTWDATIEAGGETSKGKAVYKMAVGDRWLLSDFTGDFGGQTFQGLGMDSYDPNKEKFTSVWFDSMTGSPSIFEGTYDKSGKVLTMMGEGPGPDGTAMKYKSVSEWQGEDTTIFKMYMVVEGQDDIPMMTITYKRKK